MKIKSNEIATKPIDKGSLIRVDMWIFLANVPVSFNGCVRYIFANKSMREHLQSKGK